MICMGRHNCLNVKIHIYNNSPLQYTYRDTPLFCIFRTGLNFKEEIW